MCSDANPNFDNPYLLYRGELSQAGIVHARTTFPYEDDSRFDHGEYLVPNVPTVAGIPTELYVYRFVDGKLYNITIFFHHKNFDKIADAVRAKYGQLRTKETRSYENSFGAKFEGEVFLWNNAVSELALFERAGSTDKSLLILTHKELEKAADDNIKRKIKPRTDDL